MTTFNSKSKLGEQVQHKYQQGIDPYKTSQSGNGLLAQIKDSKQYNPKDYQKAVEEMHKLFNQASKEALINLKQKAKSKENPKKVKEKIEAFNEKLKID